MSSSPLLDALKSADTPEWLTWVLQADSEYACQVRDFYARSFANVRPNKHSSILERLKGPADQVASVLAELDCHELLTRLHLSPTFEPSIRGKTPDLSFRTKDTEFIADVFLTYSPQKTVRDFGDRGEAWDTFKPGENRGKKIGDVLQTKASKYAGLSLPMVVFVVLGDRWILSHRDVERALFGMTILEVPHYSNYPCVREDRPLLTGILLPDSSGVEHHDNLSAVICCQWFDSQNPLEPGKLLSAYVLHSWQGKPLPVDTFGPLGQVLWQSPSPSVWHPYYTGRGDIGIRFISDGTVAYVALSDSSPV